MKKIVRVPASSANLGPGFDTLGLALDVYLECEFAPAASLSIEVSGRDSEQIATDKTNLIWKTISSYGASPIALSIRNAIPLGKGLGSSAAATIAGVAIANEISDWRWSRRRVMSEAAKLEGHPDNVAASVLGGVTASLMDDDGNARAVRLELPAGVEVAVVVPNFSLSTSKAREALPECYSRVDAIYNLQRVALLVAALATGSKEDLTAALGDRLHQPYRTRLVPGLAEILALRSPGILGCVLSGAGPSVLVFLEHGAQDCCSKVIEIFAHNGQSAETLHAGVANNGFIVSSIL